MNVQDYLNKVAYVKAHEELESDCYFSKFDDSYITHVGMEDNIKHLANLEITEQLTHGVGFSPKDGKWYGWSHRAMYGFKIGSTCKKGDCHYTASTPEELIDDHANFFSDIGPESEKQHRDECQILDDRSGIRILHTPVNELVDVIGGNSSAVEHVLFGDDFSEIPCGRGEWVAKTLEDAKQMAIDFNEGVS